jgi:hypothetical protein
MARIDKLLEKWLTNTPTDAPKKSVLSVIERFFPGQYEEKTGSHIIIKDDRLKGIQGYGPLGDFDVVVKGGQRVKNYYLKKLAQTIDLLEEREEE